MEAVEPLNPSSLASKTPLNVLPEKVPSVAGHLPAATHVNVANVNGITFVAVDEPKPVSTLSLFAKAGSRYEDAASAGSANFLKRLAFKSTEKKYFYPLVLDLDKAGVEYESCAGREFVSYSVTGMRSDQGLMAETLGAVYQPRLDEFEVEAVRAEVLAEAEARVSNGRTTLIDAAHREAFRDQGLGFSPNAAAYQAEELHGLALRQFVNTHMQKERLIVVGNGFSIDELKSHAQTFAPYDVAAVINDALGPGLEKLFPQLKPAQTIRDAKSVYTGGSEVRLPGAGPTQIVVAAEGVGANQSTATQIAAALLKTIVGGGASDLYGIVPSFRASRLAKAVSSNAYLNYAEAFHFGYADAGLFGVFAQADAGNAAALADILHKQFQGLTAITDAEVARAKQQLKATLYSTFASHPHALAEFYASQVAASGSALTPAQFSAQIDTVDTAAVVALAKKVAASKLTVAALGDVKGLPKF